MRLIQNVEQLQLTSIETCVCKQKNHMLPIEHVRQHARQAGVTPGHLALLPAACCSLPVRVRGRVFIGASEAHMQEEQRAEMESAAAALDAGMRS